MSHFSVLVIGENIEQQLAPYHEFECTGCNDEYVQDIDVTEESIEWGTDKETGEFSLEEALGYHGLDDKIVADISEVDTNEAHKYGYAIVKGGKLIKAVNRTNPNKQWDWWVVGGRWAGYWRMKEGATGKLGERSFLGSNADKGTADSALKKDIDFEYMMEAAGLKAGLVWDKIRAVVSEDDFSTFASWEKIREAHKGDIDAARTAYGEQSAVKKFKTFLASQMNNTALLLRFFVVLEDEDFHDYLMQK